MDVTTRVHIVRERGSFIPVGTFPRPNIGHGTTCQKKLKPTQACPSMSTTINFEDYAALGRDQKRTKAAEVEISFVRSAILSPDNCVVRASQGYHADQRSFWHVTVCPRLSGKEVPTGMR